jgi:hypothetical protein
MIGQPLAFRALDGALGAKIIVHTNANAVVVAEIELGQITMKVLLAHVEIAPVNSALQNREEISAVFVCANMPFTLRTYSSAPWFTT